MREIVGLSSFADNYIWALTADGERRIAVVDPGDAGPVRKFLAAHGLDLGAILITHHHTDHTGGVAALLEDGAVPVYGPAEAARAAPVSDVVGAGDSVCLDWLGVAFDTIEIPGHTAGHVAFVGAGVLFCGDTLFRGGCGRLFEGNPAQMRASLDKLRGLPAHTRVYCGHEYTEKNLAFAATVEPDNKAIGAAAEAARFTRAAGRPTLPSTIGAECNINPFMRWDAAPVIAAAQHHAQHNLAGADEVFGVLRQWKNDF